MGPGGRPRRAIGITASTLGNPVLPTLIDTVSRAGFGLLSIWPGATYEPARRAGMTDREMRDRLSEAGVVVHDVDAVIAWAGPGDPGPPYLEESSREEVFRAAGALGAAHVNAILVGRAPGVDACAASFATICDRAAEHGLRVTLEFGPHRAVRDLTEAMAVVRDAGRANGAVLYDTWHAHWGSPPSPWDPVPGAERVLTIQVNDAPAERPADLARATRFHRLAPGDGAIPLAGVLGALRAGGSEAPLVAEVFNAQLLERHGPLGLARLLSARLHAIEAAASAI